MRRDCFSLGTEVDRSRLDPDRLPIPTRLRLPPKSEVARGKQGDAGDVCKMRLIPMPADAGARPVLVDENLPEGIGRQGRERSDLCPKGKQEVGDRRSLDDNALVIVVFKAEPDDAPVGEMTVKIERLERERFEMSLQPGLILAGDEIGLIAKTFCALDRRTKKVALAGAVTWRGSTG